MRFLGRLSVCLGWVFGCAFGFGFSFLLLFLFLPKVQHCRRRFGRPSLNRRVQDVVAKISLGWPASQFSRLRLHFPMDVDVDLDANGCPHLYLINIFYSPDTHTQTRTLVHRGVVIYAWRFVHFMLPLSHPRDHGDCHL